VDPAVVVESPRASGLLYSPLLAENVTFEVVPCGTLIVYVATPTAEVARPPPVHVARMVVVAPTEIGEVGTKTTLAPVGFVPSVV
jgi:hypothetical protein